MLNYQRVPCVDITSHGLEVWLLLPPTRREVSCQPGLCIHQLCDPGGCPGFGPYNHTHIHWSPHTYIYIYTYVIYIYIYIIYIDHVTCKSWYELIGLIYLDMTKY
jgi:hypothetical protein